MTLQFMDIKQKIQWRPMIFAITNIKLRFWSNQTLIPSPDWFKDITNYMQGNY
jgi:hypothetical protein